MSMPAIINTRIAAAVSLFSSHRTKGASRVSARVVHDGARERQILYATDKCAKPVERECCRAFILLCLKELADQPRKDRKVATAKRDCRDPVRERGFKGLIESPDAQDV
jgi:hypothetical protein